ncbi:MAG: sugar phosphate nucleotidyltransferase [Patescibacteria group bacterium]|nr:sugar phosphate nucleotidyltransferase [Patescibacteria group bacterium]
MLYPLILSGGMGKRLWPLSTKNNPKQFQAILGNQTLLQATYNRINLGFAQKDIFVVTTKRNLPLLDRQIKAPKKNIFVEPEAKGTALAIGYGALKISQLDKEAIIVTVNSDQYIKQERKYLRIIKQAGRLVRQNPQQMVLIGIKPLYPETGYGYIEKGKSMGQKGVFAVKSFKEKPDATTARKYLSSDKYLWNPAFFVFKASKLLEWYKQFMPALYHSLKKIEADPSPRNTARVYARAKNISIDYGLLEKMTNMSLLVADIHWADIGHWRALRDIQLDKSAANVVNVQNILLDSRRNLFYSFNNKLVAALGINDIVLVETDKAILLCPADRAQEIKKLLTEIEKKGWQKYL